MNKAIVTKINYAGLEFEGLMLPDGSYGVALPQIAALFQFPNKHASRQVKSLLGNGFQFPKAKSELHPKAVNYLTLETFSLLTIHLMKKGNAVAEAFVFASVTEKIERIFDNAFGVVVEERDREARFAARLETKIAFRPLTDQLQRHGFTEDWQYGKFIKAFQDFLGFNSGERDALDIPTLIRLGNCQMELRALMASGYEPWTALELWKEVTLGMQR